MTHAVSVGRNRLLDTRNGATDLLQVKDLVVEAGGARVIDGVDLRVSPGTVVGLVGESGSGKSVTSLAIIGLLPRGLRVTRGEIRLDGTDLACADERVRREARGKRIGMIFQDPLAALNPRMPVGRQISEILRVRDRLSTRKAHEAAVDLMRRVEIPHAQLCASDYPHQLSGGQRQRVMIALALAGHPGLVLADEPTTALDVTVQSRVLQLLSRLQHEENLAMLLVSHDLRVMSHVSEQLVVMYAGRVAEQGPTAALLAEPRHPYTAALIRNIPTPRARTPLPRPLPGSPPDPSMRPAGCPFHPRCPIARDRCRTEIPQLRSIALGRRSACHFAEEM